MTNQSDIINSIASLFPLDVQIKHIESHTNKSGGNVLPAMKDDGTLYHQKLRREIVPLTLNFVSDKNESLNWEKRVMGYSNVIKHFEDRPLDIQFLNGYIIPGLSSLALGLLHVADIKDNTNINILIPKENTGFVTYNQEQDTLYFIVEYSFN